MSKKKIPFPKGFLAISLRYGILSAIIMVLITLFSYKISGSESRPVVYWNHFVLLIMMFVLVKKYRNNILNSYINFKECYISGFFNGFFASVFFSIFVYFNVKYIDTELIKNFISVSETAMNQYISGNELDRQKEILYQYSTPGFMAIRAFGELFLMSIFLPLLMSIFLKREKMELIEEESTNK